MNKKQILITSIIFILFAGVSSCRNYPADVNIIGVWEGSTVGLLDGNTLFIDFNEDGTASLLGDLVTAEGKKQEYRWKMDDYYLEFSVPFTKLKSLYAYQYSADSLTLYMLDNTNMEPAWDTLIPGYEIGLTRAADGVSIEDLR